MKANQTWEPPPAGVVKINTNASLPSFGFRGLGAVILDHLGGWWLQPVQKWWGTRMQRLSKLVLLDLE